MSINNKPDSSDIVELLLDDNRLRDLLIAYDKHDISAHDLSEGIDSLLANIAEHIKAHPISLDE